MQSQLFKLGLILFLPGLLWPHVDLLHAWGSPPSFSLSGGDRRWRHHHHRRDLRMNCLRETPL